MDHNSDTLPPPAESMATKRKRKQEKVLLWLKEGGGNRGARGNIEPIKKHRRKLPRETPSGRDVKLGEFDE